jgi:Fe-S cluster biosynthesis and repair protein YggX
MDAKYKKLEKKEQDADEIWNKTYNPEPDGGEVKPPEEKPKVPDAEPPKVEEKPKEVVKQDGIEGEPKPPKAEEVVSEEKWEHKYRTLEGIHRAEVPRLSKELKQWKETAVTLNDKIAELTSQLSDAKSSQIKKEVAADVESITEIHPEIGKVLAKMEEKHQAELKELRDKLNTQVTTELDGVKSDVSTNRRDSFELALSQLGVPDWKEIDASPEWIEWLDKKIPYTNLTRLDMVQEHSRRLNAPAVAQFFLDFKAEKTKGVPEVKEPNVGQENGKDKLEKYIAPPKVDVGKPPQASGAPTGYTKEAYTKFMKDSSKGKFNPTKWGGKTEKEVEDQFDKLIIAGELR